MIRSIKSIEGSELIARDGAIGTVKDVYFDQELWRVRYLVVATGSWFTGRTVLIASAALSARDWDRRALAVDLTKEQVRNSPGVDTELPVSRQYESQLHEYYGWPYYWGGAGVETGYVAPVAPAAAPPASAFRSPVFEEPRAESGAVGRTNRTTEGDPHLRSANVVRGYHIEASNGSIGHVEDFLFDDESWMIRYLLVDTRNWLPGKKVVVSLAQIHEISWVHSTVRVGLTREEIKSGPELDESRPVTSDYTDRLEAHYSRFGSKQKPARPRG